VCIHTVTYADGGDHPALANILFAIMNSEANWLFHYTHGFNNVPFSAIENLH